MIKTNDQVALIVAEKLKFFVFLPGITGLTVTAVIDTPVVKSPK